MHVRDGVFFKRKDFYALVVCDTTFFCIDPIQINNGPIAQMPIT